MSKLKTILSTVLRLPPDALHDALTMQETDSWDSLAHTDPIGAIEHEFAIELSADEIIRMTSIADIRSVLTQHGVDLS